MMCAIKGETRIIFIALLVAIRVAIANGEDKTIRLDDFNAEIIVPKQAIASSKKGNKSGGEKIYYFDLKDMSYDGANITVMDQSAPSTMTQYKIDAINAYKQIKATVNQCEISRDGKQFTLDVGDIVMLNRRMRFFQKAILNGDKLILATGTCAEDMDITELTTVKRATYSLRALSSKICSTSQNGKTGACKSAMRGVPSGVFYSEEMVKLAESGDAEAQCNLGWAYFNGLGVAINKTAAIRWYRKAADKEWPLAQFLLGTCYDDGSGVVKDANKAAAWYFKAAEKGLPVAQYNMGVCYERGTGVKRDLREAVKFYRMAAEQGLADAQNNLGVCYIKGLGVYANEEEAVRWFKKAAEQGHIHAQGSLGNCYYNGIGVAKNIEEATRWLRMGAEQGNLDMQCLLGGLYLCGEGVEKNLNEAIKWLRMAAENGHAGAQFQLGNMYNNGYGIAKNSTKAYLLYRKSAKNGNVEAYEKLAQARKNREMDYYYFLSDATLEKIAMGGNIVKSMSEDELRAFLAMRAAESIEKGDFSRYSKEELQCEIDENKESLLRCINKNDVRPPSVKHGLSQ